MLTADEQEELRGLRVRAFARDGELTAAQAERLAVLEERRVAGTAGGGRATAPVPDSASSSPADRHAAEDLPADAPSVTDRDTARTGTAEEDADRDAIDEEPVRSSVLSSLRSHRLAASVAALALLAAGVGVGALAFGRGAAPAVALTGEQQEWQATLLAGGDYDTGSVRALAVEDGAVIWTATKGAGERTCLIFGTAEAVRPNCELTESVRESGMYGSVTLEGKGDTRRDLNAQLMLTTSGEAAIATSTYEYDRSSSLMTYATERETGTAERLVEAGFDPGSIWVVGYDGDTPIWTATRTDTQEQCLVYDGSEPEWPEDCADPIAMQEEGTSLTVDIPNDRTGGSTRYELSSNSGPTYLVITHDGGAEGAGGD